MCAPRSARALPEQAGPPIPAYCTTPPPRRHPTPSRQPVPRSTPPGYNPQFNAAGKARNFQPVQRQIQQLDHLTAQQGWPRSYDLIKMDVQKAEKLVLQGGQRTFRRLVCCKAANAPSDEPMRSSWSSQSLSIIKTHHTHAVFC